MFKYKFLNLLETFSDSEFKSFGKFMYSPYFNESKKLTELYDLIKKYFNTHSFDKISLEMIHGNIFKDEKYNYAKTRKLLSDFTFQLENYLAHNAFGNDIVKRNTALLSEFKKRVPGKYFENEIRNLKKNLFNSNSSSKNYYISKLYLAEEELATKKYTLHQEMQVEKIQNLYKSVNKLNLFERFYIYHVLVQYNIQDDEEFVNYGFQSLNEFLHETEKNVHFGDIHDRGIYLYFMVLRLITDRRVDDIFEKSEKYINENEMYIKKSDIEFVMYTIIIYIINEVNRGRYDNYSLLIEIIKKINKKGYFDNLTEVNHLNFVEIVHFAILLNENEFAEAFIWKYFSKINQFYKEDSLNLSLAVLRYGQKRYGEVRRQLEKVRYRSYGFYLISKSLLLRIYYEENSINYIFPLIDAFKHFLKRNKMIPNYFRESFSLFLIYLTKLTSIKKGNTRDIFRIEYDVSREKNFYGKEWLEDKIKILISEMH